MEVSTSKVGIALVGLIFVEDIGATPVEEPQAIQRLSSFPGEIKLFTLE